MERFRFPFLIHTASHILQESLSEVVLSHLPFRTPHLPEKNKEPDMTARSLNSSIFPWKYASIVDVRRLFLNLLGRDKNMFYLYSQDSRYILSYQHTGNQSFLNLQKTDLRSVIFFIPFCFSCISATMLIFNIVTLHKNPQNAFKKRRPQPSSGNHMQHSQNQLDLFNQDDNADCCP